MWAYSYHNCLDKAVFTEKIQLLLEEALEVKKPRSVTNTVIDILLDFQMIIL